MGFFCLGVICSIYGPFLVKKGVQFGVLPFLKGRKNPSTFGEGFLNFVQLNITA
jgi:hypothetical protein